MLNEKIDHITGIISNAVVKTLRDYSMIHIDISVSHVSADLESVGVQNE